MSKYRQNIAAQLSALSNAVPSLSEEEFCTGILDACSGLVAALAGSFKETNLGESNLRDLVSCLDSLQAQINKLAKTAACADVLKVENQAVEQLGKLQSQMQELKTREQQACAQLPALKQTVLKLEATVQQLEKDYNTQKSLHTALLAKADDVSQEKHDALKMDNDALIAQIGKASAELKKLQEQKADHEDELAGLQKQIDAMPTEQQLVADYDKKAAELARLKTAQVECSLAKQSELDNQISALEKNVTSLVEAMKILRAREQEVLSAKTCIETEKGIFETDFLHKLQSAMDDLKNNMVAHRKALNALKDDAETLRKSIDECNNIRMNYSFMFDSLNDPLEAIAKVTEMDHEALKKYLDVNVSARVEELKSNIKRDLGELGGIIDQCREASTSDQEQLQRKVFQVR